MSAEQSYHLTLNESINNNLCKRYYYLLLFRASDSEWPIGQRATFIWPISTLKCNGILRHCVTLVYSSLPVFSFIGYHYNTSQFLFPNHPPEISYSSSHWGLSCNISFLLIMTINVVGINVVCSIILLVIRSNMHFCVSILTDC